MPAEVAAGRSGSSKLEMYPVECVVRGYLSGSGWKEYRETAAVCGIELPGGLQESDQLPEPIFTPATKAEIGEHDENIDFDRAAEIVGVAAADGGAPAGLDRALRARPHPRLSSAGSSSPTRSSSSAPAPGAEIVLGDEVLTPDSSRFWPADDYEPGRGQASFDKQYVRDWLDEQDWDHSPPGAARCRPR